MTLNLEQVEELSSHIRTVTPTGNGFIHRNDLQEALKLLGIDVPGYQLRELQKKHSLGDEVSLDRFSSLFEELQQQKHSEVNRWKSRIGDIPCDILLLESSFPLQKQMTLNLEQVEELSSHIRTVTPTGNGFIHRNDLQEALKLLGIDVPGYQCYHGNTALRLDRAESVHGWKERERLVAGFYSLCLLLQRLQPLSLHSFRMYQWHVVHNQIPYIEYRNRGCSTARLFRLLLTLISVLLPIPIIFSTQGLWKKTGEYWEQPRISFDHKYLMLLHGEGSVSLFSSSFPALQGLNSQILTSLAYSQIDDNSDGKADELSITFRINLPENVTITTLDVYIFLDLSMEYREILQVESAIKFNIQMEESDSIFVTALLQVEQLLPLPTPLHNITDLSRKELAHFAPRRFDKEITKAPLALKTNRILLHREGGTRVPYRLLSFSLLVPPSHFIYQTRFFELIKWAWIQYLAFFLPIYALCELLAKYTFENHLIHSITLDPKSSLDHPNLR